MTTDELICDGRRIRLGHAAVQGSRWAKVCGRMLAGSCWERDCGRTDPQNVLPSADEMCSSSSPSRWRCP
eukprot:3212178-Prymnesium_polylepis.1